MKKIKNNKLITIGIDGNEANIKQKSGVQRYTYELLNALYRISSDWNKRVRVIIYLKRPPSADLPPENDYWRYKVIPGEKFWILRKLTPYLLAKKDIDVFFTPSHYAPLLYGKPIVATIHDLGYLVFSGQFNKYDYWQLKLWSAITIYMSKYIIAVSQSTKDDIVRRYRIKHEKINVVFHGFDKKHFNTGTDNMIVRHLCKKYNINKNYILFLSTLKPSKNLDGLIHAFKEVRKKHDVALVIAGGKGWMYDSIFSLVKKLKLENDIIFTDYLPEPEKPALMSGALLLASPSYWEGFGIHVLEAMAVGTPVIVSRIASLPEVAGKAGVYVDPNNTESIAKGINKVLDMNIKQRNELVKQCVKQSSKFSWEKTAKDTIKLLEKAAI